MWSFHDKLRAVMDGDYGDYNDYGDSVCITKKAYLILFPL
jgi:hypothetical protein